MVVWAEQVARDFFMPSPYGTQDQLVIDPVCAQNPGLPPTSACLGLS